MKKVWKKWIARMKRPYSDILAMSFEQNSHELGMDARAHQSRHYELVQSREPVIKLFSRLERTIRSHLQSIGPEHFLIERGFLSENRRYFYLQALSDTGFLFEESDKGWLIAKADKIVQENRFLRAFQAWDAITVMMPLEESRLLRISSSRFGDELMCYPIYEDAVLSSLPPLLKFKQSENLAPPRLSPEAKVRWEN